MQPPNWAESQRLADEQVDKPRLKVGEDVLTWLKVRVGAGALEHRLLVSQTQSQSTAAVLYVTALCL